MSFDKFESPATVVAAVVSAVSPRTRSPLVADFAAGGGELLAGARKVWPQCRVVGTDIDEVAVRDLVRRFPDGRFGRCDFLSQRSRSSSPLLRRLTDVDVVLLNPPFSCRGARRFTSVLRGRTFESSRALAFVMESLNFVAARGDLVAVLPSGVLTSERDSVPWSYLQSNGAEVVSDIGRRAFSGAVVNSVVVKVPGRLAASMCNADRDTGSRHSEPTVRVYRGKLPRHQVLHVPSVSAIPYVHTTDLSRRPFGDTSSRVSSSRLGDAVGGPCVLVPRVGNPESIGPTLVESAQRFVMSDCLFALKSDGDLILQLYRDCRLHWAEISAEYCGTGAKFLTRARLVRALAKIGYSAGIVSRAEWSKESKVVVSDAI